jgi:predicted dehydrogenase
MAVTPHAKSLLDLRDRVEVVCAMSPSAERRAAFAARFPFPLCDSVERIADDAAIDAVAILTPPNTHLDLVRRMASRGKHILLEKPLEISTARAEALVEACECAGVTLGIVLQHRFKPAAERLAAILAEGTLGQIVNGSARIPLWRPQSYYDVAGRGTEARDGGGVLISQGIHTLDLMLSLMGPVAEVAGYVATSAVHRMETEDLVCAAIRYESGAIGTVEATTAFYPGAPERIDVIGTKGTASLTGTALDVRHHDGSGENVEADESAGGTGADPMAFPHDYHLSVWRDFLDSLDEHRPPRAHGRDVLKVHRLIDALIAAGASNSKIAVAR